MSIWHEDCNHRHDDDDYVDDNDGDDEEDDNEEDDNEDDIDDDNDDYYDDGAFIDCKNYLKDTRRNIGAGTVRGYDHICWKSSVERFARAAVLVGIKSSFNESLSSTINAKKC